MSDRESKILELAGEVADLSRHFALWRLLVDPKIQEAHRRVLDNHRDFFLSTTDAHFASVLVIIHQLLDKRNDVSSIRSLMDSVRAVQPMLVKTIEDRLSPHQPIFDSLSSIRSKVLAHRDGRFGPAMVFAAAEINPDALGACVDVLCDIMNSLFFALLPGREEFEFYEEAVHRADMARDDIQRMLGGLS